MTANRPVTDLVPEDILTQFRQDILSEGGPKQKTDRDIEQELRTRIDSFHLEIFHRTQTETTKRWPYESEVKRPYYHVTELDEQQLVNWKKYLDFEEVEGDYVRTKFLYERCLVTAANYEEFWLRYARWMLAQEGKEEEVRSIYQRASCIYVPISRPSVRLFYALFEESQGNADIAAAIHEAILMHMPGHVETSVALANVHRRQDGVASAIQVLKQHIDSPDSTTYARGALVSEWARLVWKVQGDSDEARKIYQTNQSLYLDCRAFWINWLEFELQQPTSQSGEPACYQRIKGVYDDIRQKSHFSPSLIKDISAMYFVYLKERGGKDAMKEFMELDRDINGPFSVASGAAEKLDEDGKESAIQRRMGLENGQAGVEANQSSVRQGGNLSTKPYAQPGELPVNGNQLASMR